MVCPHSKCVSPAIAATATQSDALLAQRLFMRLVIGSLAMDQRCLQTMISKDSNLRLLFGLKSILKSIAKRVEFD